MNAMRRITITASADELAALEAEARRRGVPLTTVVSEAITEKATSLRRARRPRLGVGASAGRSVGAAQLAAEPVAEDRL